MSVSHLYLKGRLTTQVGEEIFQFDFLFYAVLISIQTLRSKNVSLVKCDHVNERMLSLVKSSIFMRPH